MLIEDLPDEILLQILKQCPQWILHSLLKSKTVASLAYSIFYRNVILVDRAEVSDQITNNYTDRFEIDPFSPSRCDDFFMDDSQVYPVEYERSWLFHTATELLWFYKTHPLYQPHTLTYRRNKVLKDLKPSFLKRFKYLSYRCMDIEGIINDEIVVDVSEFNHKIFTVPNSCKSHQLPKHIETLINPILEPLEPMPSVKYIGHIEEEGKNMDYIKFPNLQSLTLNEETQVGSVFITTIPTLKTLTLVSESRLIYEDTDSGYTLELGKSLFNWTNLDNLKTLSLDFQAKVLTVGYSEHCDLRLPQKLENLYLMDVLDYDKVILSEHESLKKLVVSFNSLAHSDISHIQYPPNLIELSVTGGSQESVNQVFPKNIEKLTLELARVENPLLPSAIRILKFSEHWSVNLDLEPLVHLSTLSLPGWAVELPPHLENLRYVDEKGDFTIDSLNSVKHLDLTCNFYSGYPELVIPPGMKCLILRNPSLDLITGGESLTRLELINYKSPGPLSLVRLEILRELNVSCNVQECHNLPLFPPSLEVLYLQHFDVIDSIVLPKNLKLLSITSCNLTESSLVFNDFLEVLYLSSSKLNGKTLFNGIGRCLESIHIEDCILDNDLVADFRDTNLQLAVIIGGEVSSKSKSVKFPGCLSAFMFSDPSYSTWGDFVLCDCIFMEIDDW